MFLLGVVSATMELAATCLSVQTYRVVEEGKMLVQCEFYEVGGKVVCDVACERCGEIAAENVSRSVVTTLVHLGKPVLCSGCWESRCSVCKKFPTPGDTWIPGGMCWECGRAVDLLRLAWVTQQKPEVKRCEQCYANTDSCTCGWGD